MRFPSVLRRAAALAAVLFAAGGVARAAEAPAPFLLQDHPVRLDPFWASRVQIDPPTFRWPAAAGATAYRIELSRDPGFAGARAETVKGLFFRPLEPLEPGRWYWRCRPEAPRPGPWIGSESFTIAAGTPHWPLPAWSVLLDRVPAAHPRVFLRADEVARLQENARAHASVFLPWKERIRRSLEAPYSLSGFEGQVRAVAARGNDDRTKKNLIWASKQAGREVSLPAAEGAWVWLATGDPWFFDAVRKRALVAASLDPNGFVSAKNSDFGNGSIVMNLAVVYDLLHDRLPADDRAAIRRAIAARARPLFREMGQASQSLMRPHNWQENYLSAMAGAMALWGEDPHAEAWAELGLKTFVAMYPWFGGDDGGSQEGTRYYVATELTSSLDTLDLFRCCFGLRLDEGNPWFRANPYFPIYSFPPRSTLAKLGDNNTGEIRDVDDRVTPGGRVRLAAQRMADLYGNGYAAAYASELPTDTDGLTLGQYLRWSNPLRTAPIPLSTLPAARLFRDIGAVYTHSDYTHPENNVRLVFHSDPYGAEGHAHADQNSFHVIAYNEDLLIDSGYYTPVGDPHRQEWSIQTRAHNSILVDGQGQVYGGTTGYGQITHFEQTPDWVYMVGSAATAYPRGLLKRFDRHIVWLKGTSVQTYVIVDDVAAGGGARRRFDWLLHAARRMDVDAGAKVVRARGIRGQANVTFLEPAVLAFHQDDRFDDVPAVYWRKTKGFPLPNQWHLKATPPDAAQARFVAVIQVSKPGVPLPPPHEAAGAVEAAGWRVVLPPFGGRLRMERPKSRPR